MTTRLGVLVVSLLLLAGACGTDDSRPTIQAAEDEPGTSAPATAAPTTTLPANTSFVATPKVEGEQAIYDSPDATEPSRTLSHPTDIGAPLVFLVKEQRGEWLEVYLPVRPNGSVGYLPASDVDISRHNWRIEVRLSDFNIKVFQGDEVFLDTSIAVAADNTPTPGGTYYTTELLQPPDPDGAYGNWAYGLSGFSEVHQSFNGGPGQLGIHGTNQPEKIGTKVSNGCIRLRNEDIDQLAPVLPLGVPVEVIP